MILFLHDLRLMNLYYYLAHRIDKMADIEQRPLITGPTFCNATIPDEGTYYEDPYQIILDTWPNETDAQQ